MPLRMRCKNSMNSGKALCRKGLRAFMHMRKRCGNPQKMQQFAYYRMRISR